MFLQGLLQELCTYVGTTSVSRLLWLVCSISGGMQSGKFNVETRFFFIFAH